MDLFLVSLRPQAVLMGKVLAAAAAGLIQTAIWLGGAYGGVWLGAIWCGPYIRTRAWAFCS